jgi:hypothetical protein
MRGSANHRSVLPTTGPWLTVLPPVPPRAYVARPREDLPFPLGRERCTLFARARHGIWHGVRALGLGDGDEVLVPAFHSGTEVEALLRAGLACRFYAGSETLEPEEAELEQLLGPRTRALYLIHYVGLPQDAGRWRRWCDERGLLLIEDAAQAWLANAGGGPAGSFGDAAVISLYKAVGLPDGAALVLRRAAAVQGGRGARGLAPLARRQAAWFMGRPSLAARAVTYPLKARSIRRPRARIVGEDVTLGNPDSAPSAASRFLLPRLAYGGCAERRRANFARLLAELGDSVPPGFARLPPGAAPLVFLLETDDVPALGRRLGRAGVIAHGFWAPHPALPSPLPPGGARLYGRLLALPVHQELRAPDLERMIAAVRSAAGR